MNRDMSNRDEEQRVQTLRRRLCRSREMFGITQMESGYWVRLLWHNRRPRIQKFFSGEDALKEAKRFRDLWLDLLV